MLFSRRTCSSATRPTICGRRQGVGAGPPLTISRWILATDSTDPVDPSNIDAVSALADEKVRENA